MKEPGITLSKEHGINPSIMLCFYCGKDKAIALLGKLPNDAEAPRQACYDYEPCDDCKKLLEQGVLFIEIKDGTNDYRTGKQWVIKRGAINNQEVLDRGATFITESIAKEIGLYDEETNKE